MRHAAALSLAPLLGAALAAAAGHKTSIIEPGVTLLDAQRSVYIAGAVLREEAVLSVAAPLSDPAPPLVLVAPPGMWAARLSHVRAARADDRSAALRVAELPRDECADAVRGTEHAGAPAAGRFAGVPARCFAVDIAPALGSAAEKVEEEADLEEHDISDEQSPSSHMADSGNAGPTPSHRTSSSIDLASGQTEAVVGDSKDMSEAALENSGGTSEIQGMVSDGKPKTPGMVSDGGPLTDTNANDRVSDGAASPRPKDAPQAHARVLVGISYGRVARPSPSRGSQDSAQAFVVPVPTVLATTAAVRGPQALAVYVAPGLVASAVECPAPRQERPEVAGGSGRGDAPPGTAVFRCGPYAPGAGGRRTRVRLAAPPDAHWAHVARIERTVRLDVLAGTARVTDAYAGIVSDGFALGDDAAFSRTAWKLAARDGRPQPVFPVVPLCVPAAATGVSVRDPLGHVAAPVGRRPLARAPDTTHVLDVAPRFPLAFGWRTPLEVRYALPLSALGTPAYGLAGAAVSLRVPVPVAAHDWIADEVVVRVLPRGPTVALENVGREHEGVLALSALVPWTSVLRLPLAACGALLLSLPLAFHRVRSKASAAVY